MKMGKGNKRRKKYRLKPIPVAIAALLLALVIIVVFFLTSSCVGSVPAGGNMGDSSVEPSIEESSEEEPQPTSARMISFGDNLAHSSIVAEASERAGGNGNYDFRGAYTHVKELVSLADIATLNQETVLAKDRKPSGYPRFNTPQQMADALDDLGIDLVTLANNHTFDQGEYGLRTTLEYWQTIDVMTTGAYLNEQDASVIRSIEVNDITFGFVSATEVTNGLSLPKGTELVVFNTKDEEAMQKRIAKAKKLYDVVVVNVHFGVEYTHKPTEYQKEYAQKLADWGADIIVGHHPHVIQPIEWLEREDGGKTLCVYSLGNFLSTQNENYSLVGGALDVTVTKDHVTNEVEITEARFIPLVTHYNPRKREVAVYPFDQYTAELAAKHGMRNYADYSKTFSMEYIDELVHKVIDEEFLTPYK